MINKIDNWMRNIALLDMFKINEYDWVVYEYDGKRLTHLIVKPSIFLNNNKRACSFLLRRKSHSSLECDFLRNSLHS